MFNEARPIWIKGKQKEVHVRAIFRTTVDLKNSQDIWVKIATSGIYNLYINGKFVAYGPARAGRGHFRMDRIDITPFIKKGQNLVVIEVAGYNVDSYYIMNQPSFLQAEIVEGDRVVSFTGDDLFEGTVNPYVIRKVQRYSFQRPMIEAYNLEEGYNRLYAAPSKDIESDKLEIQEDKIIIERYRDKVYGLLRYLAQFENSDGLLEKLEGWIFVEWSKANELVQDVNYPTNMLYSATLACAGRLYKDETLLRKSEKVKEAILAQSFNGKFFTDNAVRRDGILVNTGEITEVCQYYAFFFNIATPETHGELFETLINDFGPDRKNDNKYPEVHFANAFIGNYLRLDVMMRYGYKQKVLDNIRGYFLYMAEKTGTLWEHVEDWASCNHGFASHVIYWLAQM